MWVSTKMAARTRASVGAGTYISVQTQAGIWADPTGAVYEGRTVLVYNSTQVGYRLYQYLNSKWRSVDLIGGENDAYRSHEARCLDSLQDQLLFIDDFIGDQIKDEWGTNLYGGSVAVVDSQIGGIARLQTGGVDGDGLNFDWGTIRSLHVSKRVVFEVKAKLGQSDTDQFIFMLLRFDGDDYIGFVSFQDANWLARCRDGGVQTSEDTGVALDTDYHIFRVDATRLTQIDFYIDGVLTNDITTNIPDDAGDYLEVFFDFGTLENANKILDLDYVGVKQDR